MSWRQSVRSGHFSKLATGSLYKRLIKETGNMALTKDKNLKALKQRMENVFLINHGIRNVNAYIEKQLYGFRIPAHESRRWDKLSVQAMILCFMAGGARHSVLTGTGVTTTYIVLYGAAGVLADCSLHLWTMGSVQGKRKQLADHLVDYVENSPHFYKSVDNSAYAGQERKKAVGSSDIVDFSGTSGTGYGRNQENARKRKLNRPFFCPLEKDAQAANGNDETDQVESGSLAGARDTGRTSRLDGKGHPRSRKMRNDQAVNGNKFQAVHQKTNGGKADYNRSTGQNVRDIGQEKSGAGGKVPTSETELAQSINHLSESLNQIAASRETMLKMI